MTAVSRWARQWPGLIFEPDFRRKATRERMVQNFLCKVPFAVLEVDQINRVGQNIARLTTAERASRGLIVVINQVVDQIFFDWQLLAFAEPLEDFLELRQIRTAH